MIEQRKKDHIRLCIEENVGYDQENGFGAYQFMHNALPECSLSEVDASLDFLGKHISAPIMISSMTGGYLNGGEINKQLAEIANELNIPLGLGSQRIMIENERTIASFSVVREVSKDLIVLSNIGGVQLAQWQSEGVLNSSVHKIVESVGANALIIHLNPLQELVQPEGDTDFNGVLEAIQNTVDMLKPLPIIVKETGAGISAEVGRRLLEVGVQIIDIAGAGGTSWSKVEYLRDSTSKSTSQTFGNWGIPTADSLRMIHTLKSSKDFKIIASGGIYSAIDMLKALTLGADYCALAMPVIKVLKRDGISACKQYLKTIAMEIKMGMCLLGVKSLGELDASKHLYRTH